MIIGGSIGYRLLRWLAPGGQVKSHCTGARYQTSSKLETLFGKGIWGEFKEKTVIDYGCGTGEEAIAIAKSGARHVFGIDIRPNILETARKAAAAKQVLHLCSFCTAPPERADVILSLDSFEHYEDPAVVLRAMAASLKQDGCVLVSFGPPWFHPLGGHLFSVFPWAHLVFTEKALIAWRSEFKSDGATRFSEVEGGLNKMTIRRFEKLIRGSEFRFGSFDAVPIWRLRFFHNQLTREFCTSIVRCKLLKKSA